MARRPPIKIVITNADPFALVKARESFHQAEGAWATANIALSSISKSVVPTLVTGNQNLKANDYLAIDTSVNNSISLLPSTANNHDIITLEDPYGTWPINNVTINSSGGYTIDEANTVILDVSCRVILVANTIANNWSIKEVVEFYP